MYSPEKGMITLGGLLEINTVIIKPTNLDDFICPNCKETMFTYKQIAEEELYEKVLNLFCKCGWSDTIVFTEPKFIIKDGQVGMYREDTGELWIDLDEYGSCAGNDPELFICPACRKVVLTMRHIRKENWWGTTREINCTCGWNERVFLFSHE